MELIECLTTVEVEREEQPDNPRVLDAKLIYSTENPLAVAMTFYYQGGDETTWLFSRELMSEGVKRAVGEGDVQMWPTGERFKDKLGIYLSNPEEGEAHLLVSLKVVKDFLSETEFLVPTGTEWEHIGDAFDEFLEGLLA